MKDEIIGRNNFFTCRLSTVFEKQFLEWAEQYETEPWGTQEEMEMFASKEELYEYLDDMMDEQDRAVEEAQFRMDSDW